MMKSMLLLFYVAANVARLLLPINAALHSYEMMLIVDHLLRIST